jgi:hypothetical protein
MGCTHKANGKNSDCDSIHNSRSTGDRFIKTPFTGAGNIPKAVGTPAPHRLDDTLAKYFLRKLHLPSARCNRRFRRPVQTHRGFSTHLGHPPAWPIENNRSAFSPHDCALYSPQTLLGSTRGQTGNQVAIENTAEGSPAFADRQLSTTGCSTHLTRTTAAGPRVCFVVQ